MPDRTVLSALEAEIKKHAPDFEVIDKKDSTLMKIIGALLKPFNKGFMTNVVTTIGQKVYWHSLAAYEATPSRSFETLAHEFVHIMDHKKHPFWFNLKYLFPQVLALPALLFILLSPILIPLICTSVLPVWVLWFLAPLVFLAPIPSPGRAGIETRGYGMSVLVNKWRNGGTSPFFFDHYVRQFTGPTYYFMWPFRSNVTKRLKRYDEANPKFLENDANPAWAVVHKVLEDNNGLVSNE